MDRDEKEFVTKNLKYASKREGGEENQNVEDWTDATNFDKNWSRNWNRSSHS